MCRIAGIYDPSSQQLEDDIVIMRDAMKRGGPDDAGIYINQGLALGHRRLSIIDLSQKGHQPMIDNNLILCYNGEIYNYQIIKSELKELGHEFHTLTDSEVILKSFKEWGFACFERFNGMFALAIYDKEKHEITLARDHAGIKPLYYNWNEGKLYFSSEIRALNTLNIFNENPDWKIYFLAFGHLPEPITTLKEIAPLEKGTFLTINLQTGKTQKVKFSNFKFTSEIKSVNEAKILIRKTLIDAVERHLISDATIGLFLSGGIDSSLLTILSEPILKDKLRTLSIVFKEDKFSEKKFQDIIIGKTGTKHQTFLVSHEDFIESLPDVMEAMDQPTIDGINTYFISKYAKKAGLTAVLSGLGADELFGGYNSFANANRANFAKNIPDIFLNLFQKMPKDKFKKVAYLRFKNLTGEYLFNRGILGTNEISYLLGEKESKIIHLLKLIHTSEDGQSLNGFNKASHLEQHYYMQNQLLKDSDCMGMWHAVEVRVPFLDKELIKLAYRISPEVKFCQKQKKFLLINSFINELPREIWDRPKQGFAFPFSEWLGDMPVRGKAAIHAKEQFQKGRYTWGRYWSILLMGEWTKKSN